MTANTPDIQELKAIVDWVKLNTDVRELSLKYGDVELFVSRNEHAAGASAAPAPAVAAPAAPVAATPISAVTHASAVSPAPAGASNEAAIAADEIMITAPMVGTFYSSPQPGSPSFVNIGDRVQADTVLCIVEVMKLMNNIEAGVVGTVTRVLAENEQAVQYGQPLIVIRVDA